MGKLKRFNDIYYLWNYDRQLKKIIEEYKFKNKLYIGELLFGLMGNELDKLMKKEKIDGIIPIPVGHKRLMERGFNQVEELLKFGGYSYIKSSRIKETKHMYELLNLEARRNNIKAAFKIDGLKGLKKVLIIDDIITTGSTMKEFITEIKNNSDTIQIVVFTLALSKTAKKINLKMR
ncbi:phosphoribosyltransferase family protein [Psychrilyobacter sp.]|uniref:ComF family protein n=1 Tax=Psychrilyobacter sp. TaxID=2586924 RepID=UPI003017F34E